MGLRHLGMLGLYLRPKTQDPRPKTQDLRPKTQDPILLLYLDLHPFLPSVEFVISAVLHQLERDGMLQRLFGL